MVNTPLFESVVQSCLGSVEAVELAAIRPPVQFLFEFNANTIHFQGSFLPILFPPGRGTDTTIIPRFSFLLPSYEFSLNTTIQYHKLLIGLDSAAVVGAYPFQLIERLAVEQTFFDNAICRNRTIRRIVIGVCVADFIGRDAENLKSRIFKSNGQGLITSLICRVHALTYNGGGYFAAIHANKVIFDL